MSTKSPSKVSRGRPSSFRPEFVKQVAKLCELAATDLEIADFFGVNVLTIHRWKLKHPDFCNALRAGKEAADNRVERSLYQRAMGYSFDSEKIVTVSRGGNLGAGIERVPIVEHVPPDVTAAIFWLKNRRRDQWRDRQDHEVTGRDGEALLPMKELGAAVAFALRKASKSGG